jgi:hypothetical protein
VDQGADTVSAGVDWMTLEHPTLGSLELIPASGLGAYDVTYLDFGFPEPREVIRRTPQLDGDRDATSLHASRAIRFTTDIFPFNGQSPHYWYRQLSRYAVVQKRPWLHVKLSGLSEAVRIQLRAEHVPSILRNSSPSLLSQIDTLWRAPTGRFESVNQKIVTIRPGVDGDADGREYPLVFPRIYPNIGPLSGTFVTNAGSTRTNVIFRIFGPTTGPAIVNETLEAQMSHQMRYVFKNDFVIAQGNYAEINVEARTILLNGNQHSSLLHQINWEVTNWWSLIEGLQQIRFIGPEHGATTQLQIRWRNSYIL